MDTKEKIMEVSCELFAKLGYDAVSIRDIIQEAKVNLGAITYHFGGKEELYKELIQSTASALRAEFEKIEKMEASPTEKLKRVIRSYLYFLMTHPVHTRLILREMSMGNKRFMEIMSPYVFGNFGTVTGILKEGIEKGEFREVDIPLMGISIFGSCSQYVVIRPLIINVLNKPEYDAEFIEKVIQHTTDIILRAIEKKKE